MPVVRIDWFKGRDRKAKEKVAQAIEKAMVEDGGCPPGVTYIIFNDVERENWAVNGKLEG